MNVLNFIWVPCLIGTVLCASLGEDTTIHARATVAESCSIGKGVYVDFGATIGNNCIIGDKSFVGNSVKIGNNAKFGSGVQAFESSTIGDNVEIGDNAILYIKNSVGSNVKIQPNAHIGPESAIGDGANIGESAIIQEHVHIPNNGVVPSKGVVAKVPSSIELLAQSTPAEKIPDSYIEEAEYAHTNANKTGYNDFLRDLIDIEFNSYSKACDQTDHNSPAQLNALKGRTKTSPLIKAVYLIGVHGADQYKKDFLLVQHFLSASEQGLSNEEIVINGEKQECPALGEAVHRLENEVHFLNTSGATLLEPDVVKQIVELLAFEREESAYNTFCGFFEAVRSGQREVTAGSRIEATNSKICA